VSVVDLPRQIVVVPLMLVGGVEAKASEKKASPTVSSEIVLKNIVNFFI
jgi:hypothetical protein